MYDQEVLDFFLKNQTRLFPEQVASTSGEAEEFLEDCMAAVCPGLNDVREYLDGSGMDVTGMSDQELAEADEVFALPDGRFLVVEG